MTATPLRWPVHPRPQPYESLSSWLERIAREYTLSREELFEYGLAMAPVNAALLDRQPPPALLSALATRTGITVQRLQAMTLMAYVPWLIDTLDHNDADCLSTYAGQYRVLLPPGTQASTAQAPNPVPGTPARRG